VGRVVPTGDVFGLSRNGYTVEHHGMAVADRMTGRDATARDGVAPARLVARRLVAPFALAAIAAVPVLLTIPFMHEPFDRDEGAYATIAQGLTHGLLPYRDLFDHKPPGIYVWYALSFRVFGESVVAPRLMGGLVLAAITLLLFRACSMLYGKRAGWVGAGVFALSTGIALINPAMNTEPFTLLPMVAALVAFLQSRRHAPLRWCVAAGVLGGVAVMTKPVAIFNIGALAAIPIIGAAMHGEEWSGAVKRVASIAAGGVAACAAACLPFVAFGALPQFLYANVRYNSLYEGELATHDVLVRGGLSATIFLAVAAPFCIAAFIGLHTSARLRRWPADPLVVLWFLASAAGMASTAHFFMHYYVMVLPALALLVAALTEVRPPLLRSRLVALAVYAAVGVAGFTAVRQASNVYFAGGPTARHAAKEPSDVDAARAPQNQVIGTFLKAHTFPNQTIWNYGRDSQIYFYADRSPAVRFFYDRPFWLDHSTLIETIASLRRARPEYIIDTQPGDAWDYHPPELMALLAQQYDYVGKLAYADLYRLKVAG